MERNNKKKSVNKNMLLFLLCYQHLNFKCTKIYHVNDDKVCHVLSNFCFETTNMYNLKK